MSAVSYTGAHLTGYGTLTTRTENRGDSVETEAVTLSASEVQHLEKLFEERFNARANKEHYLVTEINDEIANFIHSCIIY